MDLNQFYFDHQVSPVKAEEAARSALRRGHESDASRIAGRIGHKQASLGAAAACAWIARACEPGQ
jgi:hypothetical protein